MTDSDFFTEANADLSRNQEHLSPSGKFKLVVTPYATKPGCWAYTQGRVYRNGVDSPIAEVRRNYSSFPFLFIEDHPRGPFLICGEDYQGQTVIELDTGKRADFLPEAAAKGHGFCWVEYKFDAPTGLLVVRGCVWACPYEFRIYDFSDPMNAGWPEIESDHCMYDDDVEPTFESDGTIKFYQPDPDDDDSDEETPASERPVAAIQTFKREGLKLVRISEWVSDTEQKRRQERDDAERKYEEWRANFRATDPLYLTYAELVKDPTLSPDSYESHGITHDRWCPDFKEREARWCRRIIKGDALTIDLEWAVKTGPIKLELYRAGKHVEDKFFPHSTEGMHAAFAYAKEAIHG